MQHNHTQLHNNNYNLWNETSFLSFFSINFSQMIWLLFWWTKWSNSFCWGWWGWIIYGYFIWDPTEWSGLLWTDWSFILFFNDSSSTFLFHSIICSVSSDYQLISYWRGDRWFWRWWGKNRNPILRIRITYYFSVIRWEAIILFSFFGIEFPFPTFWWCDSTHVSNWFPHQILFSIMHQYFFSSYIYPPKLDSDWTWLPWFSSTQV